MRLPLSWQRRIAVSYIVLKNDYRAGAALFRADVRLHVRIVNVPSEVFPVFWYDCDQTSYPSIALSPLSSEDRLKCHQSEKEWHFGSRCPQKHRDSL